MLRNATTPAADWGHGRDSVGFGSVGASGATASVAQRARRLHQPRLPNLLRSTMSSARISRSSAVSPGNSPRLSSSRISLTLSPFLRVRAYLSSRAITGSSAVARMPRNLIASGVSFEMPVSQTASATSFAGLSTPPIRAGATAPCPSARARWSFPMLALPLFRPHLV